MEAKDTKQATNSSNPIHQIETLQQLLENQSKFYAIHGVYCQTQHKLIIKVQSDIAKCIITMPTTPNKHNLEIAIKGLGCFIYIYNKQTFTKCMDIIHLYFKQNENIDETEINDLAYSIIPIVSLLINNFHIDTVLSTITYMMKYNILRKLFVVAGITHKIQYICENYVMSSETLRKTFDIFSDIISNHKYSPQQASP
eukprot:283068_1